MGALARGFRRRSWAAKAYIAAKLVGPLGVVLVAVGGMGHDHAVLVVGITLLVVFAIDMLLFSPILAARRGLRQRRDSHGADPN
jgi:hypothetical protein